MYNKKVRVAIIGVGNCASSLVQGVHYYRNVEAGEQVPGIMHTELEGIAIRDIEFSAAFDVNHNKVGRDLSEAIVKAPNNTVQFAEVPYLNVPVMRGPSLDGIGKYAANDVSEDTESAANVVQVLKDTDTDVVINYLPVGSEKATEWYVEQVLQAGCAFVNCVPVFIASSDYWGDRFKMAGLPIIGDDIKSQVGATIVHRVLTSLFAERGVQVDNTYQLNFGGNMDFKNMLERERLESKKISKTQAVTSMLPYNLPENSVHVGPSDYVPWLTDRKFCYIQIEGTTFGDVPLKVEVKLEVWDSPNSAGVVIDAVRYAKLALDRGLSGPLETPSAYLMKSPPLQFPDDIARQRLAMFVDGKVQS